ncbi:hypothetical protein SESBI_36556 [Sesbania bispinosa]|nr:hypothetical protein SESBI_36556 [Sesbania bispinosa]
MDGGHVWSVAPCGNDAVPTDEKIINSIMLRFRPIAPKPVAGASSVSGGSTAQASQNNSASLPRKRTKRKYVRIRKNSGYVRKNGNKSSEKLEERRDELDNVAVVTLQLMPEKDAPERSSLAGDSWCKNVDLDLTVEKIQILENRKPPCASTEAGKGLDQVSGNVVESWVTVESVTGTCMGEGGGLGCTDAEKVKNLETDTCPGFVSDGFCRVRWVNDAYKRMVESEEREIVVWLKVKESVAWCYSYPAFTCGVRLQYTWRNEKCTKMVPCDVWRLECGGFAWRLDVKAALSLGL